MDIAERNALVEKLLPIVTDCVDRFIASRPSARRFKDDLIQDGSLKLIEAVDSYQAENLEAYVTTAIDTALIDSWQDTESTQASRRTIGRIDRQIKAVEAQLSEDPDNDELRIRLEKLCELRRLAIGSSVSCDFVQQDNGLDLSRLSAVWSDVLDCCETDEEEEVIYLRSSGMTDSQVAEKIGDNRLSVLRMRQEIEGRFSST